MLKWWNFRTTISSGWPINVYRRQSIFGGYRLGKSGDVKVPPWGLSELLYTTQEQPVKEKCHIDIVYDKCEKFGIIQWHKKNEITENFDNIGQCRVTSNQHCKFHHVMWYLALNDFNVLIEISGLVDNEIHYLTLLPGWGARACKKKVFLFPKWSRRSANRSSVLAFILPAMLNAKLEELN